MPPPAALLNLLQQHSEEHLLAHWDQLSKRECNQLQSQLLAINWHEIAACKKLVEAHQQRRNKQNIESTLKKAKQTKLKLLDLANQKLESDKQDHLEAEIVLGNISQQEAQLIEQVLPTEFLFELQ